MHRTIKVICAVVAVPLFLLIGCVAADRIPRARATPPKSITDVSSCLAWLKEPMAIYRVSAGGEVYYEVTGPAGRYLASGPAGYTFDSRGQFMGWSLDIGDFKTPPQVFTPDAKWESITIDELRQRL